MTTSAETIAERPGKDPGRTVLLFLLAAGITLLALVGCASRGASLFQSEGCIGCHRFKGVGGRTCPDLTAVTNRRSAAWIRQQITDSTVNNPRSRMPSFSHLSELDVRSIVAYLQD